MNGSEIDSVEGDGGYESEVSLSETDDSEGEVPDVTGDAGYTDPLSNRSARAVQDPVWSPKSPTVVTPNVKDGSFTRGWKPVIDGKIQVGGEMATNDARKPPLQAADAVVSSQRKRPSSAKASPSPAGIDASERKRDGNESDSDERRVPEMSSKDGTSVAASAQSKPQSSAARPGKRGGGPADKERKRLKRLLRNRVSAQQARERKKAYLGDLEIRSKELQQRNEELEERVSTLLRENYMLRQIVKNTTGRNKAGGSGNAMDS